MMHTLPKKATSTPSTCTRFGFSRSRKIENRMAKNGESLLSIFASGRFSLPMA